MAFNPRRQPPSPKKERAGGGEGERGGEGGLRSAIRELCLQPPGAKGWQVSGLSERRARGRSGTRCARSGGGGWWSKVAGTAKGGVTGGSGREGGARAGAPVCPAGAGGARATEGKGVAANQQPKESRELAPNVGRQRPASWRGAEAGAERVVKQQGLISQRSSSAVPPADASQGSQVPCREDPSRNDQRGAGYGRRRPLRARAEKRKRRDDKG